MRLFQNSGLSATYLSRLQSLTAGSLTFSDITRIFLNDRYCAAHILSPVLDGNADAFFANGDHFDAQRAWARENGVAPNSSVADILLAQIEHHGTEVFYNLDPMRFGSEFLRRLPGCVRFKIAWRAAPSAQYDFAGYDRMVCNFPSILKRYEAQGLKAEYLFPAHDPELDAYASNEKRPIDVLFVGGYSRHHVRRATVLEAVAALHDRYLIEFLLDTSRMTRLAETPLGIWPSLGQYRRPPEIRAVAKAPVFGRALYEALSRAKIVLNGAVDMAGADRGNMRCWEALGAGALMVSDDGNYPIGMTDAKSISVYSTPEGAAKTVQRLLDDADTRITIARAGHAMVRELYSKARQWSRFVEIVG